MKEAAFDEYTGYISESTHLFVGLTRKNGPLIPPNYSVIDSTSPATSTSVPNLVATSDGRLVPLYEKPKPVLRMLPSEPPTTTTTVISAATPLSVTTRSMASAQASAEETFAPVEQHQQELFQQQSQSAPLPPFSHPALQQPQDHASVLVSPPIVVDDGDVGGTSSSSAVDSNPLPPPPPPPPAVLTPEEEAARLREIESQRQIEEWMISEGVSLGPEHPAPIAPHPPPPFASPVSQTGASTSSSHVALKIPNLSLLSV